MEAGELKGYTLEDTVVAFDLPPLILEMTRTVCQAQDVQIFETNCLTDLVAVPNFLVICDFSRCDPSDLQGHYGLFREAADKDFVLLLTRPPPIPPPVALRRHIIRTPREFHKGFLELLITRRRSAVRRRLNDVRHYDTRLARLFTILRTLEKRGFVSTADLCNEFNVSQRTVARDLELLRTMGEPIEYDPRKKRYYFQSHSAS